MKCVKYLLTNVTGQAIQNYTYLIVKLLFFYQHIKINNKVINTKLYYLYYNL